MNTLLRCLILSFIAGTSCKLFFETIVPIRQWQYPWVKYTAIPAFAMGQVFISFTPIPPYILQPVRFIIIMAVIAQVYFQMRLAKNLVLSVLFCGIYWSISTAVASVFYFFYGNSHMHEFLRGTIENLTVTINMGLMMAFHIHYKNRIRKLADFCWKTAVLLPFLCLAVLVAFNLLPESSAAANRYATLAIVSGIVILNIFLFYLVMRMLEKEEQLQKLQLHEAHARNQMNMYYAMQSQYELQRRFLHDYKNQLNCIQGLLDCGQTAEASGYIARITGNLRTQFGDINTNHTVVNIILNQKYQSARNKGIAMTFVINDLSGLSIPEEELVTLLTNPLDNAIEACDRFNVQDACPAKTIQFKLVLEEDQLILSVRNPVISPVPIKNNTVITSKKDSAYHGLGLSNVDAVVRKYHGTSVLTCKDGWFSFTANICIPNA